MEAAAPGTARVANLMSVAFNSSKTRAFAIVLAPCLVRAELTLLFKLSVTVCTTLCKGSLACSTGPA